jgi:hypothetical protein
MVHEDELHAGVSSTLSCPCLGRHTPVLQISLVSGDTCSYGKSIVEVVGGRDEFLPITCDRGSNCGVSFASELRDQVCCELIYHNWFVLYRDLWLRCSPNAVSSPVLFMRA